MRTATRLFRHPGCFGAQSLAYECRNGVHTVIRLYNAESIYHGHPVRHTCDSIEEARGVWAAQQADLLASGYAIVAK